MLIPPKSDEPQPPLFTTSSDAGFMAACRQLLADRVFLEQMDYGYLLQGRGMRWHEEIAPEHRGRFGKAFSFFERLDGALVGVAKLGWVVVSSDGGNTWDPPSIPSTLVSGGGKIWGQRTADGRCALVYNPSTENRWPLCLVASDDGRRFRDMRIVHGEMPPERYPGTYKDLGPQYMRGIWKGNPQPPGGDFWLAYSVHKEDIWISRVPVPVRANAIGPARDDFENVSDPDHLPDWNIYRPRWATVAVRRVPGSRNHALLLEDRDPYDYARAMRVFPESAQVDVQFKLRAEPDHGARLEIELISRRGERPVRLVVDETGHLLALNGAVATTLRPDIKNRWLPFHLRADTSKQRFSLDLAGRMLLRDAAFAEPATGLDRLSFRTGEQRCPGSPATIAVTNDRPVPSGRFYLDDVRVNPASQLNSPSNP